MKESASITQTVASAAGEKGKLWIHFPDTIVSEAAVDVTVAAAAPAPTLSVANSSLKGSTPDTTYIAFSVDLDAPFPSFPILGPILHGMQADLLAGVVNEDGFTPLEGPAEWNVMPYRGPGPPKPSAPHRYVFMVFEQPEGLDAAKVKTALGLEGRENGLLARIRWDQEAAEKKLGLGEVVAGNYFLTRG